MNEILHSFRNPFSGIRREHNFDLIVPRFSFSIIDELNKSSQPYTLQLVGKKGRGKTTHLRWVAEQLTDCILIELDDNQTYNSILESSPKTLLIDGIQHLSIIEKHQLFRSSKNIIYTCHSSLRLMNSLYNREFQSIRFSGSSFETLKQILDTRILHNNRYFDQNLDCLSDAEINQLLISNGDNIRSSINQLYSQFQLNEGHISN